MGNVNYIIHLNRVFEQFRKDPRLNSTHIALYMGLFQLWNLYKFKDRFFCGQGGAHAVFQDRIQEHLPQMYKRAESLEIYPLHAQLQPF